MRVFIAVLLSFFVSTFPAVAQDGKKTSVASREQRKIAGDKQADEIRENLAKARKRQVAIDHHNSSLWTRWTHAVCLGCDPTPKGIRIVHTYPHRVLIGIPAAEDDARERRGERI